MEEQPAQGVNKTTIILAAISGVQAIFLALVGTGQVPQFAKASEKTVAAAVAERTAANPQPPGISVQEIAFKEEASVEVAPCLQRSQTAIVNLGFELTTSREEQVTTLTRGPVTAVVWCYQTGLFLAVAGPRGSDPQAVTNSLYRVLGAEFIAEAE